MTILKATLAAAMITTALSSSPAFAQAAGDNDPVAGEGEIVVTAQRREQRLVDVPISVSAVSSAAIDRAQVRTVTDIATIVPNIQINETVGNSFGPLITIRGAVFALAGVCKAMGLARSENAIN